MKLQTILDRAGNVLHQGDGETKKAFVEALIASGESLANADLRNLDLSRLVLDGGDLKGADLSGASLRGTSANGTRFDGSILKGVKAEGMTARAASFIHTTIGTHVRRGQTVRAIFDGAVLTHSRFEGASIEDSSFEGVAAAGASFRHAHVLNTTFKDALLHNVDWCLSEILRCKFNDAELHARTETYRIPRASLPNRSRECVAVGNDMTGAIVDDSIPAFKRDKLLSGLDSQLAWAASTGAMLLGASYLPIEPSSDWFGNIIGHGTVLVGALLVANMLKEKAVEFMQDHLSDATLKVQLAIRSGVIDALRRSGNLVNSVVAIGRGPSMRAIVDALRATAKQAVRDGIPKSIIRAAIGDVDVIVCDRRRMAVALEWISMSFYRTELIERDVVVARLGEGDAPSVLKFFAGGGMAAFWVKDGAVTRTIAWDADEMIIESDKDLADEIPTAMEARLAFEQAAVSQYVPGAQLQYDPGMHQLRAGRDGSVVVTDIKNQLPRNKKGTVLLRPTGESFSERAARELIRNELDVTDGIIPDF